MQMITKEQALAKLDRAKALLKSAKEEGARMAELGTNAGLTVMGGIGAGVLAAKMPKIPNTTIDTDLALGGALCTLAMLDVGGDYGDQLNALGAGLLAAGAARETAQALARRT